MRIPEMELMEPEPVPDRPPRWDVPLVELYRLQRNRYVRLAYLMTGDRGAAEEIVHDAFLAATRTWDGERDPGPYVRAAVVNRCRSWGRRQQLERVRRTAPPTDAVQEPDELWDALQTLTPRQRAAIVLRFYDDLPDDEIAAVLGCRSATVRTSIHRALRALRKEISR